MTTQPRQGTLKRYYKPEPPKLTKQGSIGGTRRFQPEVKRQKPAYIQIVPGTRQEIELDEDQEPIVRPAYLPEKKQRTKMVPSRRYFGDDPVVEEEVLDSDDDNVGSTITPSELSKATKGDTFSNVAAKAINQYINFLHDDEGRDAALLMEDESAVLLSPFTKLLDGNRTAFIQYADTGSIEGIVVKEIYQNPKSKNHCIAKIVDDKAQYNFFVYSKGHNFGIRRNSKEWFQISNVCAKYRLDTVTVLLYSYPTEEWARIIFKFDRNDYYRQFDLMQEFILGNKDEPNE